MADVKISALASYSTQHGNDLVPILDVHDTSMASSGTDKGCTVHNLFGAPTTGQFLVWSGSSTGVVAGHTLVGSDLPVFVASGSSHAPGAVPDPGASAGTTKYLREDATWEVPAGSGTGTVTSVTFTGDGTVLDSNASSAVTTSGTLTATLLSQSANKVLAGPTTTGSALPTFRSIVPADLPVFVESGASHAIGAVPDPGATPGTSRFLCENATWGIPPGSGNVTSVGFQGDGVVDSSTISGPVTGSGTLVATLKTQVANKVLAGPITAPDATPTFRSLVYGDLPVMIAAGLPGHAPGAVPDPGAVSSGGTKFLCDNASWLVPPGTYTPPGSGPGSGSVSSIGFQGDGVVDSSTVSGPVTGSGTLVATIKTQAANKILAGPTSGADAAPTFRSLVAADLPGGSSTIYSQVASVSVTTTNDTSFVNTTGAVGSVSLASDYLTAGKALRFRFGGYCSTASSPGNWKIGVFFGSTCIATTTAIAPPANQATYMPWMGEILLTCTVGGGAGTSKVWSSGLVAIHAPVPVITWYSGVGPAASFGAQSNGAALSPNLSTGITLDLKANSSGVMSFQNWTLTHLIIESLG